MNKRFFNIDAKAADPAARTAPIVLSTTTPVLTRGGPEVLDHNPDAIDLSRVPLPLLVSHNDRELPVGIIENLATDGQRLRGQIRLGTSARADEIWRDIQAGILRSVSVGFDSQQKRTDDAGVTHITRWTPIEGSLVAAPADMNAGLYRKFNKRNEVNMSQETETETETPLSPRDAERQRVLAINATRKRLQGSIEDIDELADEAIERGTAAHDFLKRTFSLMESEGAIGPKGSPYSRCDANRYSEVFESDRPYNLMNAILAQIPGEQRNGVRVDDGYEREVSKEIARRSHRDPRGIFVPLTGTGRRDLAQSGSGGNLVATNLLAQDFIELLRNRTRVLQLGATVLSGLVGNVAIPSETAAATASWMSENGTLTESDQTFGQLTLSPHMLGAFTKVSRRMLLQATPAVQQVVERDLALQLAVAIDAAAISGTGSANQPTGILNTSGIGSVAIGTNGGAPTYDNIVGLYQAVAAANADRGALGFLTNANVKSTLLTTPKIGTTFPEFVWESPSANDPAALDGAMLGYRAAVSNNVPSNLTKGTGTDLSAIIFGNWNDLVVANWGGLDILVDPFTYSASGEIGIVAWQAVDIGVRHAASFAAIEDAVTT